MDCSRRHCTRLQDASTTLTKSEPSSVVETAPSDTLSSCKDKSKMAASSQTIAIGSVHQQIHSCTRITCFITTGQQSNPPHLFLQSGFWVILVIKTYRIALTIQYIQSPTFFISSHGFLMIPALYSLMLSASSAILSIRSTSNRLIQFDSRLTIKHNLFYPVVILHSDNISSFLDAHPNVGVTPLGPKGTQSWLIDTANAAEAVALATELSVEGWNTWVDLHLPKNIARP